MNSYIPLDQVRIATPCSASWEAMTGDDRVRHCSECSLSVYNISEMSKQEAETLVSNAEGRLCIRMYKRADGTIITQDCPVGMQAVRARVARKVRAVAAATLTFVGSAFGINTALSSSGGDIMGKMVYVQTDDAADTTAAQDTLSGVEMMMGGIAPAPADTVDQPEPDYYEVMGEMEAAPEDTIEVVQGVIVEPPVEDDSVATVEGGLQQDGEPTLVIEPEIVIEPKRVEPGIR